MSTRVLCVHDHAEQLTKLTGTLQQAGYDVVPAKNGAEALQVLESETVQGVVFGYDAEAPGGHSLRNRIGHLCPDVPLLMFSDVEEVRTIPLDVFRAYLDHPGPPATLLKVIPTNG